MPAINKRLALKVLVLNRIRKRMNRKVRSTSIRPIFFNRLDQGESVLVKELRDNPHYHHRYFRMNKENFDEILDVLRPHLTGGRTHSRPISAEEKLAVALRYLASGNSQISLSLSYRISPSSISNILRQVFHAISKYLGQKYLAKPTEDDWKGYEEGFRLKWNHPNCVGALDGKHVRIQAPSLSGSTYYNYKGYFSIVLLAVVDPEYKFTIVDIGASGSQSDGGVLSRSMLGKKLEDNSLCIPGPKIVGEKLLPHVIAADDAFPLKTSIMKPFPGKFLPLERRVYNYRLSRARMVVENTFGILAARWRIFNSLIIADKDLANLIVESSVILHNYLITKNDLNNITLDKFVDGNLEKGSWREDIKGDDNLQKLDQQGSNNFSFTAAKVREDFMNYFNSEEGSVSWQASKI